MSVIFRKFFVFMGFRNRVDNCFFPGKGKIAVITTAVYDTG